MSEPMNSCCAASAASDSKGRRLADLPFGGDIDLAPDAWCALASGLALRLADADKLGKPACSVAEAVGQAVIYAVGEAAKEAMGEAAASEYRRPVAATGNRGASSMVGVECPDDRLGKVVGLAVLAGARGSGMMCDGLA